jgi:ribonucleoside-diphosphate reductase alpha chain|tara:strand:- start:617 stop:1240 length:624 start_codon:yes stop_codon:yes gene_type:complete
MIKLNTTDIIKENKEPKNNQLKQETAQEAAEATSRPEVVDAKVYKLKSAFVKNSVFITLSYVKNENGIRPIEIFINSKDLTKTSEYVVLTRLISAIFRRGTNPMFILEELQGIFDPNGGSFKEGKYYHSFYSEIADVIERFFYDVKIIDKPQTTPVSDNGAMQSMQSQESIEINSEFRICPTCSSKSLKTENGCDSCMSCGYSKCDK